MSQVVIEKRVFDFWLAECNEIHALMDAGQVPRKLDGGELSIAQRVRWYYETREAANAALEKASQRHTSH